MNRGTFCCPICLKSTPHTHSTDRWIGVDFDGTIAFNVLNRTDPYVLGEPIPEMVNRVKDWIAKGFTVKLLTARMNVRSSTGTNRDICKMNLLLRAWCLKHIGVELECTNSKDGWMEVLWDDRAVTVTPNSGTSPLYSLALESRDEKPSIEGRFKDWAYLSLRVHPSGQWCVLAGDRVEGDERADLPYRGVQYLGLDDFTQPAAFVLMIEQTKNAVAKIIQEIDKSVLLGAAYDCMSETGKLSFQTKLEKIIEATHEIKG